MNYTKYAHLFKKFYNESSFHLNKELKGYVNFKVGGPADILVEPDNENALAATIQTCNEFNIPFYIIGNGSNLLVKDKGFRGVVIVTKKMNHIEVNGDYIIAECGAMLKDISNKALKNSLTGFEFASGIPGTMGGAVCMNAGAYGGEIKDVISIAKVINRDGRIFLMSKEHLGLGYRTSDILKQGFVLLSATIKLERGESKNIKNIIEDLTKKREDKQPLNYPSAGSTFKRPEGYFAGKLIQDAGLRGYTIGGAAVSDKHCGFVINKNNATAKNILDLISYIQKDVKNKFNVDLETEVKIIGED